MKKHEEIAAADQRPGVPMIRPETRRRVAPPVDVYETQDGFVLLVDLPGATRESIGLILEGGALTVRAEVAPYHAADARLLFRELAAPLYERSFTIGDGVDRSTVDARFDNGVLTVKLFKKEELKPREITIH